MPQHTVKIIDSAGNHGRMKLRRVREHQAAKRGEFDANGVFVFVRHRQLEPETIPGPPSLMAQQAAAFRRALDALPQWPARLHVAPFRPAPDRQGFLPYPQPSGITGGVEKQFSGLAKMGAGL